MLYNNIVVLTRAAVCRGTKQIVHPVGVQDERRIGYVVLAGCLGKGQALLEHGQYGLGHRLGPPRLERPAFPEPQVVHEALVGVPALLPHGLQLVLVTVGCRKTNTQLVRSVYTMEKKKKYVVWPSLSYAQQQRTVQTTNIYFEFGGAY